MPTRHDARPSGRQFAAFSAAGLAVVVLVVWAMDPDAYSVVIGWIWAAAAFALGLVWSARAGVIEEPAVAVLAEKVYRAVAVAVSLFVVAVVAGIVAAETTDVV